LALEVSWEVVEDEHRSLPYQDPDQVELDKELGDELAGKELDLFADADKSSYSLD